MTSTVASRRPIRRNRITTSDAVLIGCVSAASALGGALADAHPTAWAPADALLTAAAAGFVAWCGASAPWWLLAGAAGVAVLTASSPAWTAAGAVGFVVAVVIGARRSSWPVGRAASAGLTINALLQWGSAGFHGFTAIVTGAIAVAIVVGGLQRRRHLVRRTVYRVLAVIALVGVVAALGAAVAVARAIGDARAGERALRDAAAALGDGDIDTAVAALAETEERIGRASDELRSPWARPALAVPMVGQHLAVTADVARDLEALSSTLAVTAGQINVDALRVASGVVDVDAN
jgi:hypothetical protein